MRKLIAALFITGAMLTACTNAADTTPQVSSAVGLTLTPIAEGLEFPWGMAQLPTGEILVTEREGNLRIIRATGLDPMPIGGVPEACVIMQGGLLDIVLDPDFASNRQLFLSYAVCEGDFTHTAVARAAIKENTTALVDVEVILRADVPERKGGGHFGSRLGFLPDGTLLVTLGDGFRWMDEAQNTANHFGKILRINTDGSVPADNPFVGVAGAAPEIYSYGHRNVQGLAIDTESGTIWQTEHGPMGGDELNRIEPGVNYGWPVITYGVNYDGTPVSSETKAEGMAQPEVFWVPSIAPSGLEIYTGDVYPNWQGDLFLGAMNGPAGRHLVRIDLENSVVVGKEILLADQDMGFRDVMQGLDGHLYLATMEAEGEIYRLDVSE